MIYIAHSKSIVSLSLGKPESTSPNIHIPQYITITARTICSCRACVPGASQVATTDESHGLL